MTILKYFLHPAAYDVCVHDWPQFVYDSTSSYTLNIDCTDGVDTSSSTLEVILERNGDPYFTNTDCKFIGLVDICFKASAHSFKQFTSRLLKSTFSLSLCTYVTRMDVMLDFICMGPVDLTGAHRKRQNTKWKIPCPQWHSNPQPFDSKSDALPTELAGLGECYPFKWPYYIHVLPILMHKLL